MVVVIGVVLVVIVVYMVGYGLYQTMNSDNRGTTNNGE